MTDNRIDKIKDCLSEVTEISDEKANKFLTFFERMVETNEVMNLTAITEFDEVLVKHFLDSVYLLKNTGISSKKILDLGTGAGFPGVPLKIVDETINITYLDSLQKRMNYLERVCSEINLSGCEFVHGRAEDFGKNIEYREKYDFVVSRAVANLSTLSEYALPFVKVGGYFVSYKSEKTEEEISEAKKAIDILGGKVEKVETFNLGEAGVRSLVFIKKIKNTPKKYPRKPGTAKKEPIV